MASPAEGQAEGPSEAAPPPPQANISADPSYIRGLMQNHYGFQKKFYTEVGEVKNMTKAEVQQFWSEMGMEVDGDNIPHPIRKFSTAGFPDSIRAKLMSEGFKQPSPIQTQSWPAAMSCRDVIGVAETGSGKTLAFLLPAIVNINAQPELQKGDGPVGLVLAPTRELSSQIYEEFMKFRLGKMECALIYGGVSKAAQKRELQSGVHMIVGTPGRVWDFLGSKATNLRRTTLLVFDEADRMLDMGFADTIQNIVGCAGKDRQTLMFTATWGEEVATLSTQYMKRPITVRVGAQRLTVNKKIKQKVQVLREEDKIAHFISVLKRVCVAGTKVLVFSSTRKRTQELTDALSSAGWPVVCIHGDKPQSERDQVLGDFKGGLAPVLIATDVAARGLDIKDVTYVVNFDMPTSIAAYIHRIGRTGRAGSSGRSISFITDQDEGLVTKLVKVLEDSEQKVPMELREMAKVAAEKEEEMEERRGRRGGVWFAKTGKRRGNFAEDIHQASSFAMAPTKKEGPAPPPAPASAPGSGGQTGKSEDRKRTSEFTSRNALRSSFQKPSRGTFGRANGEVILIRNMALPEEIDEEFESELAEELTLYGEVEDMQCHVVKHWNVRPEESVRIFVRYSKSSEANLALLSLTGRFFNGRVLCCAFYDFLRFQGGDLDPSLKDPAMPRVLLLRNLATGQDDIEGLKEEVEEECTQFGPIVDVKVQANRENSTPLLEQVRVFIQYQDYQGALKAFAGLHGRTFASRTVYACFFDEAAYIKSELDPSPFEPAPTLPSVASGSRARIQKEAAESLGRYSESASKEVIAPAPMPIPDPAFEIPDPEDEPAAPPIKRRRLLFTEDRDSDSAPAPPSPTKAIGVGGGLMGLVAGYGSDSD